MANDHSCEDLPTHYTNLAVNWQMAAVVEICPHPIRIWWQTSRWPLLRKSAQQIAAVANLYSVLAEKWQISASKNKT